VNALPSEGEHEHSVEISIDGENYTAPDHKMTVNAILGLAGKDPSKNYLVEKVGREQKSFQNEGDEVVTLHPGEVFITVPLPDATVS
jgi:hypothetical protein